ncbi:hypothetical protein GJAV_G00039260 [Gymnothorax javanicus]|nr:hypothetical protein GJAV_G00039260 [Gymnothorax javanicus]
MQQERSFVSPLLSGVFCQCSPEDMPSGSDPGGGAGTASEIPPKFWDCSQAEERTCELSRPCAGGLCSDADQENRLKVLFQVLDVNKDGGICVNDLTIGLKKLGVHRTENELMIQLMPAARNVLLD